MVSKGLACIFLKRELAVGGVLEWGELGFDCGIGGEGDWGFKKRFPEEQLKRKKIGANPTNKEEGYKMQGRLDQKKKQLTEKIIKPLEKNTLPGTKKRKKQNKQMQPKGVNLMPITDLKESGGKCE